MTDVICLEPVEFRPTADDRRRGRRGAFGASNHSSGRDDGRLSTEMLVRSLILHLDLPGCGKAPTVGRDRPSDQIGVSQAVEAWERGVGLHAQRGRLLTGNPGGQFLAESLGVHPRPAHRLRHRRHLRNRRGARGEALIIERLPIPPETTMTNLVTHFGPARGCARALRRFDILYDEDEGGRYYQFYSRPLEQRLHLRDRRGAPGGNRALRRYNCPSVPDPRRRRSGSSRRRGCPPHLDDMGVQSSFEKSYHWSEQLVDRGHGHAPRRVLGDAAWSIAPCRRPRTLECGVPDPDHRTGPGAGFSLLSITRASGRMLTLALLAPSATVEEMAMQSPGDPTDRCASPMWARSSSTGIYAGVPRAEQSR